MVLRPANVAEEKIIESWKKNVAPWIAAVQNGEIESRVKITNDAILKAVLNRKPHTALDIGCGEGWLVRALEDAGIRGTGIDAISEFIAFARKTGRGKFKQIEYDKVSHETLQETFDVVVCNFSLLGSESVETLFKKIPSVLNPHGVLIVQTVHPIFGCGELPYEDGWRAGSWAGFSERFCNPAPWYFRTIQSWMALFNRNNFEILSIDEPINDISNIKPSILFVAQYR